MNGDNIEEPQDVEINTNNFFCWLPGDRRRETQDEMRLKIIRDIDSVLAELGIDGQSLHNEIREANRTIIEQAKSGDYAAAQATEQLRDDTHRKLLPVFMRMLDIGHDKKTLIT